MSGGLRYIGAMIFALFLAASAPSGAETDRVRFEILIAGGLSSGFTIDALERAENFEGDPHRAQREPERFIAEAGTFNLAQAQLARYRSLASATGGCVAQPRDVLAFRITWRENGASQTVTFADSCEGIPEDLIDAIRPLGEKLDRAMRPRTGEVELGIERE